MNGMQEAAKWIFRNLLNLQMNVDLETLGILRTGVSSRQVSINVKPNVPLIPSQIYFRNGKTIIPITIRTHAHGVFLIGISSQPISNFNVEDESGNYLLNEYIEKNSFKLIVIKGDFQKDTDVEFTFIFAEKENNYFFEVKITIEIEEIE